MPPASAQILSPHPDRDFGLSLLLGSNYEREKKKLQQELQLDYKQYATKKKDLKMTEPHPQYQGLSLPIDERIAAREKLKEERNKEYNLFLQGKAKHGRLPPVTSEVQAKADAFISSPASQQTNMHPPPGEHFTARRDVATLTETVTKTRGRGRQRRKRWQLHRPTEPYSSEEEPVTDKELGFSHRRKQNISKHKNKEQKKDRAPWDIEEGEKTLAGCDENNNECVDNSDPDNMGTAARCRPANSKDKAEVTTGLMIGAAEEKTASLMRKEQYKQELLKQIAEQQKNKLREKKLELRVAATGATDPEKEPDRIKHFGAVKQQRDGRRRDVPYIPDLEPNLRPNYHKPTEDTERREQPGKDYYRTLSQLKGKESPGSGTRPAQSVPSLDCFNEDHHRDFSNILGEVANRKVASLPHPPLPPTISNNYKTPYDAAYFYYGTRNPLDHDLPYNQNDLAGGVNFYSPPQRPAPLRPGGCTQATDLASPLDNAGLPADTSKQRRERALSYQEALRQQIKEREERKIREKEEQEQYDAKIDAEIMAYNCKRGGGGAPIIDQNGNLVSDLNKMHRTNTESGGNGYTPSMEARAPLSHQVPEPEEQVTPQLPTRKRYEEDLKQQMKENKQRQAEAKERLRIKEELEEKKLAEQRARIQQEYEAEQSKLHKPDHMYTGCIHEPETQHKEEKSQTQEGESENIPPIPSLQKEQANFVASRPSSQDSARTRERSPPIPTLQRKQKYLVSSRPVSQVSATEHSRPIPAKMPQLQDGCQEVIRQLSALRRYLRNEQRQLEIQADRQGSHYTPPHRPRGRPRGDASESAHKQTVRPSTRSLSSGAARVNMRNIREFNQLKYRDSASREEVCHMYPDPPTDAQSLDIQQQALLREQQRKIRLMKTEEEQHDVLDQKLSHYRMRNKHERSNRDSILKSESFFIGVYSGDGEEWVHQRRPSAEQKRTDDHDEDVLMDQRDSTVQTDAQSLRSRPHLRLDSTVRSINQHGATGHRRGDHSERPKGSSGDEVDVLSLSSALERHVSMDTVATEAWLRPGTSDTAKCKERPKSGMDG